MNVAILCIFTLVIFLASFLIRTFIQRTKTGDMHIGIEKKELLKQVFGAVVCCLIAIIAGIWFVTFTAGDILVIVAIVMMAFLFVNIIPALFVMNSQGRK